VAFAYRSFYGMRIGSAGVKPSGSEKSEAA
jgi:hypothetical protein